MSFGPCWSPGEFVSVRSPAVSDSHVHAIQPSVWSVPPASPPSLDANGETDLR